MKNEILLGIDFGTTTSCVSYYNKELEKFIVIQNKNGNYTTPSCIYFNQESDEILYGEDAYYISKLKSSKRCNFFNNIKRLIGKDLGDLDEETGDFFSENIIENDDVDRRQGHFVYLRKEERIKIKVEEIIIYYLNYLKKNALGSIYDNVIFTDVIINVIITVPTYYNDLQRNIIRDCFMKCNMNVKRIVDEPTAAALYYNYINDCDVDRRQDEYQMLVFDCGGGTTDISVINVDKSENVYDIVQVVGDNYLGGLDVTKLLVEYMYLEFKCKVNKNKLYSYCDKLKCELTYKETVTIYIEENDLKYTLSRHKFNQICKPFFDKIKQLVDKLETDTRMITGSFDDRRQGTFDDRRQGITNNILEVIFVGGSSKIPYLNDFFSKRFPNAKISSKGTFNIRRQGTLEVDKIVSLGATLRGVLLYDMFSNNNKFKDSILVEITHMTLGVETVNRAQGVMCPIISKNTIIPVSRTVEFTNSDNLSTIDINVYQGENRLVKDNFLICTCRLENVPKEKNKLIIKVTFTVNLDGILIVEAKLKDNEDINVITTKKLTLVKEEDIFCIDKILNEGHF
jgi:molecular chaperone DnaK (HSP70)